MDKPTPSSTDDTASAMTWTERGTSTYRRTSIALFLAGFVTFTLVYDVQPLLPEFATDFQVSAATSSLALSVKAAALAIGSLGPSIALGVLAQRHLVRGLTLGAVRG